MTIHEHLQDVGLDHDTACAEAREYASQYQTAQEVWDNCTRVDWLFWWAEREGQAKQVAEAAMEIVTSVKDIYNTDAVAAYAVERKWQANFLRMLVPNPFDK